MKETENVLGNRGDLGYLYESFGSKYLRAEWIDDIEQIDALVIGWVWVQCLTRVY